MSDNDRTNEDFGHDHDIYFGPLPDAAELLKDLISACQHPYFFWRDDMPDILKTFNNPDAPDYDAALRRYAVIVRLWNNYLTNNPGHRARIDTCAPLSIDIPSTAVLGAKATAAVLALNYSGGTKHALRDALALLASVHHLKSVRPPLEPLTPSAWANLSDTANHGDIYNDL